MKTLTEHILESLGNRLLSKGTWIFFFVLFIVPSIVNSIDERLGWMPIIISAILGICCIGGYAIYCGFQEWKD